jgi:peptidoglycan hydrolase-like protein with peptidoglycan-binding domain
MKKTLQEELERIHGITYGKEVMTEGFLDNILSKVGLKKKDDPKKADLVSKDVEQLYSTLEDAVSKGGLSQQQKGSMGFQKEVESMQIGLTLLGYTLPKYGVDGLFGPETASAVSKFTSENVEKLNEDASELRSTLDDLGHDEKGNELTSGGQITDEISGIVSDILIDYKSVKPKVQVVVTAGNDNFHKGSKSRHSTGQAVDLVIKPYNSENARAFINVLNKYKSKDGKFSYIDEYTNPSKNATGPHFHLQYGAGKAVGGPSGGSSSASMTKATPEMLNKLIELLKARNIEDTDIKQYLDPVVLAGGVTDSSFYAKLLENLGAPVSEENLKFLYAWRQAEGSGGKFNPFNTTWDLPGSVSVNSHGVKSYKSIEDGMVATLKTLRKTTYSCIVNGLKNDIGADKIAKCESLKTWGTGDLVAKVVRGYNTGSSPKIKSLS